MSLTEVLSPVGNEQMLVAAVRSGADAVYLGAKDFSARRNAENFGDTELKNAIKYCHIRGVKVYLTLNILIKDSEMQSAFNLAKTAYNYGVDGIIIEDLGLAAVLHRLIPELPLHASTQMSVHTPSALEFLKKMGFCRVVAAREMSFSELKAFCARAKELEIEVEVFVHGALCMSVSGQCLMSAFLGSRSGNRGLCAGPCRLPFSVQGGTGNDLSLKDLSLLSNMKELIEIGVVSFKIEGRMKRPEYVAAATAACRAAVDTGYVPEKLENILKSVFSRSGFTNGYFTDELGIDMFGIRTKEDVVAASDVLPQIHELYRGERRSVKINVKLTAKSQKQLSLTLDDGQNRVTALGEIPQIAQKKSATFETLKDGIDKFGSTPYILNDITVDYDDGLFIRVSELNDLRRKATDLLDCKRGAVKFSKSVAEYVPEEIKSNKDSKKVYARFEDSAQIPENLDEIDALIFPLEKEIENLPRNIMFIVDIPRGIISEKNIRNRLSVFKGEGFKTALCGNISALEIAKQEGFDVIADTGMNTYNTESANVLHNYGVKEVILSNEITLNDASGVASPIRKGIISYGKIPLMLFKNCPLKNGRKCSDCDKKGVITDRKNTDFPVRCRMGYSELLNSVPIWLADRKNELKGIDFTVLYFTRETKEEVVKILDLYKNNQPFDTDYTRGLFYRGTI